MIELMIVVMVLAILVGIAVPSYQDSVRKSRRGQAKSDLVELAQAMDRYYTINGSYTGASLQFNQSPRTGGAFYDIAFEATPTAQAFTIKAIPKGGQAKDSCGELSISSMGVKRPEAVGCW